MKNTGKPSEELFDAAWKRCGKHAFNFKFADSAALTGMNKKVVAALAQPSDRLIVHRGAVEFAEVKSTNNPTSFPFSMLRRTQKAFAAFVLAAGGQYVVYVHSLIHNQWFRIPYDKINSVKEEGRESIKWEDLIFHKWIPPHV
jgi:penicillin-binding protein-related factor A (putative recombinase)